MKARKIAFCEINDFSGLRDGLYKDIGILTAMAIVHGAQWPGFFHREAYNSFAKGPAFANASLNDIMDFELRHQLIKVIS